MIFSWLKRRRREKLMARPFPAHWLEILERNVSIYWLLGAQQREKVQQHLRIFHAEKHWEGCGGLVIDDEIKVTVSAQMAILVLGLDGEYFDNVLSILVYPDAFVAPERMRMDGGVVTQGDSALEGEAWYRGPVILSWTDVLEGSRRLKGGHDLVFHEFAHQLDMLNGRDVDGMPPLDSEQQTQRWTQIMNRSYRRLIAACENGEYSVFSCYGTTNIAEFFAVATEVFFQCPEEMEQENPELYDIFRAYYRQDPVRREQAA